MVSPHKKYNQIKNRNEKKPTLRSILNDDVIYSLENDPKTLDVEERYHTLKEKYSKLKFSLQTVRNIIIINR